MQVSRLYQRRFIGRFVPVLRARFKFDMGFGRFLTRTKGLKLKKEYAPVRLTAFISKTRASGDAADRQ
jgi:hypothetical protein